MDGIRLRLENELLDRIKGRVEPCQAPKERLRIILQALSDFCAAEQDAHPEYKLKYLRDEAEKKKIIKELQHFGVIDSLLKDPMVEDIIINGTQPIYIHHTQDGFKKTDKRLSDPAELSLLVKKIFVFSGKTELKKINNVDLLEMRGRVNIVYSPMGPELTITKLKSNPLSIIDLIEKGALNVEMASLLWLYVEGLKIRPANILISGGPGSGKTTLLNALFSFIPFDQHIVVIEDTFELLTNWIENVSRLETDEDMSLADLVKNSLRMRPERVIVGEVRGKEALDMITAMNTGKYCMATIHASTVREIILRLESEPMNVPETLINLIDVFIVMRKNKLNEHILRAVGEISESAGLEQKTVLISPLWRFDFASNSFNSLSFTTVYRDRLAQAFGIEGKQVLDEIARRKDFLEALRQNKINSIKDVSICCALFIQDPKQAALKIKALTGKPQ